MADEPYEHWTEPVANLEARFSPLARKYFAYLEDEYRYTVIQDEAIPGGLSVKFASPMNCVLSIGLELRDRGLAVRFIPPRNQYTMKRPGGAWLDQVVEADSSVASAEGCSPFIDTVEHLDRELKELAARLRYHGHEILRGNDEAIRHLGEVSGFW